MANATYDNLWQQAMGELSEQLHVEGVDDNEEEGGEAQAEVSAVIYITSLVWNGLLYISTSLLYFFTKFIVALFIFVTSVKYVYLINQYLCAGTTRCDHISSISTLRLSLYKVPPDLSQA